MAASAGAALVLAGCGDSQNALAPKSHQSHDIATLFWWMAGGAFIGLALVVGLLLLAWRRRDVRGLGADTEGQKPGERISWYVVVGAGIALPVVLLSALFVVADIFVMRTTQAPAASATRLTIRVIGHQWWWEVRYPGTRAVTANEIHIPVHTPVRVEVSTADVIHSFWVPELNRKVDAIPGTDNAVELSADAVGRYRGACAEFCGIQHAWMGLVVVAQPAGAFRRWLDRQAAPAAAPTASLARAGAALFQRGSCASCHTIRGTDADGDTGPDLTHVAGRSTIAALALPNDERSLERWIAHPQSVKPGNQMPDTPLPEAQIRALAAYLDGLR